MRAHQAADASRVNVRHVGHIQNQKLGAVRAHHGLQGKEVSQQQRPVQANHRPAWFFNFLDLQRLLLHKLPIL